MAVATGEDRPHAASALHALPPAPPSPRLPAPPTDGVLHIVPRSPETLFVWFRLPEDQASNDLVLREIRASDGKITRELPLGPRSTHSYIDAPAEPERRELQVGCLREGRFLGFSSRAPVPHNASPPPGPTRWRERGDSPRSESRTPPRHGPLPATPAPASSKHPTESSGDAGS